MAFCRHGHGAVGNGVGKLCQGVPGAWGDYQQVEQLLGADGLYFFQGCQRFSAADAFCPGQEILRLPKSAVGFCRCRGKNRNDTVAGR